MRGNDWPSSYAGRVLVAATRDRDELLDQIVKLVVPALADSCVVFLPTPDGKLSGGRARSRWTRPGQLKLAGPALAPDCPGRAAAISARLTTSGTTLTLAQRHRRNARLVHGRARRDEHRGNACARAARSARRCWAGQDPLGVIALYRGGGRPPFTETDVSVVEELGRRLAVGLANTDTFAREHAIAETLQRAPPARRAAPDPRAGPRGALPARHQGAAVGGDWYDAFPLGQATGSGS